MDRAPLTRRAVLTTGAGFLTATALGTTAMAASRSAASAAPDLSNKTVKISVQGGRLIGIDGSAFAALLPEPDPDQRWRFVPAARSGPGHYAVADARQGFTKTLHVTDDEDFAQAAVGFVPVGHSFPPYFSPAAVWSLEPAEDGHSSEGSGYYHFRNRSSNKYIGRSFGEDRSLNPKPILNLPDRDAGHSVFFVEVTDDV